MFPTEGLSDNNLALSFFLSVITLSKEMKPTLKNWLENNKAVYIDLGVQRGERQLAILNWVHERTQK